MSDFKIILMVAVISFVTCTILAIVVYSIDKYADRRDSQN